MRSDYVKKTQKTVKNMQMAQKHQLSTTCMNITLKFRRTNKISCFYLWVTWQHAHNTHFLKCCS